MPGSPRGMSRRAFLAGLAAIAVTPSITLALPPSRSAVVPDLAAMITSLMDGDDAVMWRGRALEMMRENMFERIRLVEARDALVRASSQGVSGVRPGGVLSRRRDLDGNLASIASSAPLRLPWASSTQLSGPLLRKARRLARWEGLDKEDVVERVVALAYPIAPSRILAAA